MKRKCVDCGIYEAITGDELCEECRERANEPVTNPLIPAIERVIAELSQRREDQADNVKMFGSSPETYGRIKELEHAIKLLKEVLSNHEREHTNQRDIPTEETK